jgi:methyltransferase (TIGR00027 family)
MAQTAEQGLPTGVGLTGLNVARGRAAESRRADRLFNDPYAQEFVAAATPGLVKPTEQTTEGETVNIASILDAYVPIRTRFFDACLHDACQAGCRQVVLVAAGLDTRAFRLTWPPGVCLFELDLPDVFRFKERVLHALNATPACRRATVPADLREDWPAAMLGAGFQPGEATVWLLEGILMYLTESERNHLLERVGDMSIFGSRLALEPPGWTLPASLVSSLAYGAIDRSAMTQLKSLMVTAQRDASVVDPVAWLAGHGWNARLFSAREQFAACGRPLPPALETLLSAVPRWLALAERP